MQAELYLRHQDVGVYLCDNIIDELYLWDVNMVMHSPPKPKDEVLPGIVWGDYHQLFTPAYWKFQYEFYKNAFEDCFNKLGESIIEEVVACLLGGYGIPSEIGLLAFQRIKNLNLIRLNVTQLELQEALLTPLIQPCGKQIKYRFPKQKSKYVASFLSEEILKDFPTEDDDLKLRNWLLIQDGIGPKTASWVTRNWLSSEKVAILDIHILRAGMIAGFFPLNANINKDYLKLENYYLEFCEAIHVRPSIMDAIIWRQMKNTNKLAIQTLTLKIN